MTEQTTFNEYRAGQLNALLLLEEYFDNLLNVRKQEFCKTEFVYQFIRSTRLSLEVKQ